jgi:hypothetical protein
MHVYDASARPYKPVTARSTWLRYRELLPTCRVIRPLNPRLVRHVRRGELRMELAHGPCRPL